MLSHKLRRAAACGLFKQPDKQEQLNALVWVAGDLAYLRITGLLAATVEAELETLA
jgi:hypothetical protein